MKRRHVAARKKLDELQLKFNAAKQEVANKQYLLRIAHHEADISSGHEAANGAEDSVSSASEVSSPGRAHTAWAQQERERLGMAAEGGEPDEGGRKEAVATQTMEV